MAAPSTFTPTKPTSQTSYLLDLKWTKNVSRHSHQPAIKTRFLTDIPAEEDSSRNEVLFEHPPLEKQDSNLDPTKFILKLPPSGSKEHKAPVVEEEAVRGENPNLKNADAVVAAALAAKEAKEVATKSWNLRPRKPLKPVRNPNSDAKGAAVAQHNRIQGIRTRPARVLQSKKPPEPRIEISLTLTREEIEEDFLRMTGKKPARRPKKRLKAVQKRLDILISGQLCLDDISAHGSEHAKLNKGSD